MSSGRARYDADNGAGQHPETVKPFEACFNTAIAESLARLPEL
jgi:hypothetical protein